MTSRQKTARAAWRDARKNFRNAEHGFREVARKAYEAAAVEVLRADVAARDGIHGTDGVRVAA